MMEKLSKNGNNIQDYYNQLKDNENSVVGKSVVKDTYDKYANVKKDPEYDPYTSIKPIHDYKRQWAEATYAGDYDKANMAAENAKKYYEELRGHGYGDIANELASNDYYGSKKLHDTYATADKVAIRPFFKQLAKSNHLSEDEINDLITYNGSTERVSLGGVDLGLPYSEVDGVSYWDKDKLQKVWDTWIAEAKPESPNGVKGNAEYSDRFSSAARKQDEQWGGIGEYNKDYMNMIKDFWGYATTNLADSPEFKTMFNAIMPYYNYMGHQDGYNAIASGAATNSGNLDTHAAANAARQRNAQLTKGAAIAAQLGMEAHQNRLNNINNILTTLGAHRESVTNQQNANIDRDMQMYRDAFEFGEVQRTNDHNMSETTKLNDHKIAQESKLNDHAIKQEEMNNALGRQQIISDISGLTPYKVKYNGILYDDNGNLLVDPNKFNDIQAVINKIDAQIKTAATDAEKAELMRTKEMYQLLRAHKVFGNMDKYGKYADTVTMPARDTTAAVQLANEQLANEWKMFEQGLIGEKELLEMQLNHDQNMLTQKQNFEVSQSSPTTSTEDTTNTSTPTSDTTSTTNKTTNTTVQNTPTTSTKQTTSTQTTDTTTYNTLVSATSLPNVPDAKQNDGKEKEKYTGGDNPLGLTNSAALFINDLNSNAYQKDGKAIMEKSHVITNLLNESDKRGLTKEDADKIMKHYNITGVEFENVPGEKGNVKGVKLKTKK